jgi:transcriptional regulator with XRE-family HTH domain/anti-sigma regulatory factor (Ser/Thr protein kinase)
MTDGVVSLGERLRLRREQLGISQSQAARELDVARTAYRLWEMEAAKPAPDRWRLIARWLGISVATMLLAGDLLEDDEAREADVISGRFPLGWDAEGARERGAYFDQEQSLIERAARDGQISPSESTRLNDVLGRVERQTPLVVSSGWNAAMFEKELPTDPSAPALARAAVLVAAAGVPESILLDAELLTSELVTNGLQHGPPDAASLTVRIAVGEDLLRVEVEDAGSLPAVARAPDAEGGWGMALVIALATRWGGGRSRGRNVTWFEMDLPRPGATPAAPTGQR